MNKAQIIEMAKQAGAWPELSATPGKDVAFLWKFYQLAADHAIEEAAKACDEIEEGAFPDGSCSGGLAWECADAIRAMKGKP